MFGCNSTKTKKDVRDIVGSTHAVGRYHLTDKDGVR